MTADNKSLRSRIVDFSLDVIAVLVNVIAAIIAYDIDKKINCIGFIICSVVGFARMIVDLVRLIKCERSKRNRLTSKFREL